jgi:hypothetical protein
VADDINPVELQQHGHAAKSGLNLVFWASIVELFISALSTIAHKILWSVMYADGSFFDSNQIHVWLTTISAVSTFTYLVCVTLIIIGLVYYAELARKAQGGPLFWCTLAAFSTALMIEVVLQVMAHIVIPYFIRDNVDNDAVMAWYGVLNWAWVGWAVVQAAGYLFLLALVQRVSARQNMPIDLWRLVFMAVLTLLLHGLPFLRGWLEPSGPLGENAWLFPACRILLLVGFAACLVLVIRKHVLGLSVISGPAAGPQEDELHGNTVWIRVRDSLRLYRSALISRIVILVLGYLLIWVSAYARSLTAIKLFTALFAVGGLLVGIVIIVAQWRYTSVPKKTAAWNGAISSLVIMLFGSLLEIFSLYIVFSLYADSHSKMSEAIKLLPYVVAASQVVGLLGLLTLLHSFGCLGKFIELEDIRSRAWLAAGLLIGLTVLIFPFRILIAAYVITGPAAIVLGLALLGGAITAVVIYLNIVRDLADRIGLKLA